MIRFLWLACFVFALLASPRAHAWQARLLDPSQSSLQLTAAHSTEPSVHPGWVVLEVLPSLIIDGYFVAAQVVSPFTSEGSLSGVKLLSFWSVTGVIAGVLSTSIVYGLARLSGAKPSYLSMLFASVASRLAGSILAFVAMQFAGGRDVNLILAMGIPLGLSALFATGMEVYLAAQPARVSVDDPPALPPTPAKPATNNIDASAAFHVPLMAFRF